MTQETPASPTPRAIEAPKAGGDSIFDKWIPAQVLVHIDLIAKYKLETGLWVAYPMRQYSVPPKLKIIAPPSILEIEGETQIRTSSRFPLSQLELKERIRGNFGIIHEGDEVIITKAFRVKVKPGNYIIRIKRDGDIHILPSKKPIAKPRYKLVIVKTSYKSTSMGAYATTEFNPPPVYQTSNRSAGGAHANIYSVFIVPVDKKIAARHIKISNRGNRYEKLMIIDKDIEEKPRFEELETTTINGGWVEVKRVFDNWEQRKKTIIELIYHDSRKTAAQTMHNIDPADAVKYMYTTANPPSWKTHWSEVYELTKPATITTIRISNNGNKQVHQSRVEP